MSTRTLRVVINGTPYTVETDDLTASPLEVRVNGEAFTVELPADDPETATTPPQLTGSAPTVGTTVEHVSAPMPGTIIAINVQAGAAVKYKQELCVLEAMKMNNSIRAPQDGVIAAVHIAVGQSVAHGDKLFTYG